MDECRQVPPDTVSKGCGAYSVDGRNANQPEESQKGQGEERDDAVDQPERQPHGGIEEGGYETQLTSEMSRQPHKIQVIVHNDTSESLNNDTVKWFTELKSGFSVEGVRKEKSSPISSEIYTLNFDETSEPENENNATLENLERNWCEFVSSNDRRHLWLEVKHPSTSVKALTSPKHKVEVMSMSLGSFPSAGKYYHHWSSGIPCPELKIAISFEYDLEIATISYEDLRGGKWKLETAFEHLDKFLLVKPIQTGFHVYLFQKNPFKILQATKSLPYTGPTTSDVIDKEELAETEFLWKRQVLFGDCQTDVIGSSNVVHLEFGKSESRLNDVLSRFAKLGFSIMTGNPSVENASPRIPIVWPEFKSFRLTYAWYCLISRGFKVTDQVTKEFVDLICKTQSESWFEATIKAVTAAFDNNSICNLQNQFQEECAKIKRKLLAGELEDEDDGFLVPHVVAIRRLILTPTTIKGLGEEWTVENRVLRKFGSDRFVRISFRDEDFTRLTGYIPIQEITNRVVKVLTNGFDIGNQHYRFLGCSNSQMRSHSVWMYASDGENTVESIRTWMGNISHERCVATYVSRLGQCFTSTRNTVEVKNVERIEDIDRDTKYCFTDGIGRISSTLASRVKETLHLGYAPSAFQIRFGGCKGVVALAPDIGEEEKLQIRKSMEKFPSQHNHIEVVETTRPVRLCLNRQAILLLSGLGVPDDSFFKLQDRMLENMVNILIDEDTAAKVIAKAHLGIEFKELKESGIAVTLEPFLREVLAMVYRQRFNDLLRRTHIEIPEDRGRMMMGTVDEFDCLKYGEVFVQFSNDIDKPMEDKVVVSGNVVVTKSPCFHPGDMRKFRAVDNSQLHHMVDCIVFPAKGQRPHPNEMSGSDLDGDMYFVCWEESLIPPGENKEPMDFTSKEKQVLSAQVTESDMIRFIGNYIRSDQLGVIANAHLVHADSKDIHCNQCIQIAQTHSDAVDFPKTGQQQKLPGALRPASYPNYMMKNDKPSYISDTVIGKLFHQCRTIELSNEFRKLEPILPDPDLILPGHETYLDRAKTMKATYDRRIDELKAMYGIETEVELLSVGALGMKERLGHLKGDHYAVTEIIRLRIDTIKEKIKAMFYEEFGGSNSEHDNALLCLKASALYRVWYGSPGQDQGTSNPNRSIKNESVEKGNLEKEDNTEGADELGGGEAYRKSLGLPWIFSHLLCMIKKEKTRVFNIVHLGLRETDVRPTSFLHKLSLEIAAMKITSTAEDWKTALANSQENSGPLLIERLQSWNSRASSESEQPVQLICFGSAITALAGDPTSLDVFVHHDSSEQPTICLEDRSRCLRKISEELVELVGGNLMKNRKLKTTNNVKIINIPGTVTEITLYSDMSCLHRTANIVAAIAKNKWTIPVLRVVLQWGRNCRIADSSRDSLLTEEELSIMFYHAVINGIEYGNPITDEDLTRSNLLILDNHFQTCNLFQCTHLQTDSLIADISSSNARISELCEATKDEERQSGSGCSKEDEDSRCGPTLLEFFRFYGISRGSNLKEIPCPHQLNDKQCLLNLKDQQYVQVGEQMMEAYHSLANCANIYDFISLKGHEDQRFAMVLPNEVTSLFGHQETIWENILKRKAGASVVNIRRKAFRGFPSGHIIEAWGSATAIKSLSARIQSIISSAACFTEGKVPRARWLISGANRTIFQGISRPTDEIAMFIYDGRCQSVSDKLKKQFPLVTKVDLTDAYNVGQVSCFFEEQREFIRKNYKPEIHGGIRVTISFGTFYTVGFRSGPITAGDLSERLSRKSQGTKGAHVKNNSLTPVHQRQYSKLGISEVCDNSTRCRNSAGNVEQRDQMPSASNVNTTGLPVFPNPPNTGSYERFSPGGFNSDSAFKNYASVCSLGIPVKHIPPNASSYSREDSTENASHFSGLLQSDTTGLYSSCQKPTLNYTSGLFMNCPSPQFTRVQQISNKAAIHQGKTQVYNSGESPMPSPRPRKQYGSFLPMNDFLDFDRFMENFLKPHNFVETEHVREYRVRVNLGGSSGIITLDENFELTKFHLQDIKWFLLNVGRCRMGKQFIDNQAKDIRIQMRSRPFITAEELAEREGCQDLLKNAHRLLHKNNKGVVDGIALPNYRGSIEYMRYKDQTSYQFRGKTTRQWDDSEDSFLNRFTLKLNRGKEYRLPVDGIFTRITNQGELTLETELPNLENKEECDEFIKEIYEFSKDFAKCVIDS